MGQGRPGGWNQGPIVPVAVITSTGLEPNRGHRIARVMKHATPAELDEAVTHTQTLIAEQQARIDGLEAEGGDSSRFREFLESFKRLLAVQEARRQRSISRRRRAPTWSRLAVPADRRQVA